MYYKAYINHKSTSSKIIFFTNKIDYYWEFEQQVSNVQEVKHTHFTFNKRWKL